ncbi:WSC-containing protein [Glarea lozoyensis ATCC 20868]|uniref:WSC-containing protein n=1 Tax=Glarea lozoyensis (strain ATCC 20868 / MF5171) TaxID=1116229 RepID=S3D5N8_GLAL2|nr:WSC-containing protein [Glarea lozoyensis ATCC 20868]EPE33080.1 WSC-containing protein [Glarea lozoyensis ATCC 20868]
MVTFWLKTVWFFASGIQARSHTDSLQDADSAQSGYLPSHNLCPKSIINSKFTLSWKNDLEPNEIIFAKPLVYTPPWLNSEQVITVSSLNMVRIIDGLTGKLLKSRILAPPFQAVDARCTEAGSTIGITGTPIIDPDSSVLYLYSKGYKGGVSGPRGTLAGQYKLYALKLPSLSDVSGFPVVVEGPAENDKSRYFLGGTVLQRASLASVGNSIVAGFAGHCDNFNYTGMLVAVSKIPRVGVTSIVAMMASPGAPQPQELNYTVAKGGKAGIWESGMGFAVDDDRIFFATGNGDGPGDNGSGLPANGKKAISTLQQTTSNFIVTRNGKLKQQDYFQPYNYQALNAAGRDFGSAGVTLLDEDVFRGRGVRRIAISGGKSGRIYIMNGDDLGGFANVLQSIDNAKSLFSGTGSYPREGGYIYFNPLADYLYAYKITLASNGKPLFVLAGKSNITLNGRSTPTITSFYGRIGTGISRTEQRCIGTDICTLNRELDKVPQISIW